MVISIIKQINSDSSRAGLLGWVREGMALERDDLLPKDKKLRSHWTEKFIQDSHIVCFISTNCVNSYDKSATCIFSVLSGLSGVYY